MHEPMRVAVVADGELLVQALRASFHDRDDVQLLGPARDLKGLRRLTGGGGVALVVVDLDRLDAGGVALVTKIHRSVGVPILVSTVDPDPEASAGALIAGACGVLPPGRDPEIVVRAFARALTGELVLPERARRSSPDETHPRADALATLTRRELEVLDSLADGLSTREIALRLSISRATVQAHVKNVLAKLGVPSKVHAVRVALRARPNVFTRSA